jgi:hypothetical protein
LEPDQLDGYDDATLCEWVRDAAPPEFKGRQQSIDIVILRRDVRAFAAACAEE